MKTKSVRIDTRLYEAAAKREGRAGTCDGPRGNVIDDGVCRKDEKFP